MKYRDNIVWLFALPATLVLGLVGLISLITVINYSFFDFLILDARFWVGTEWYGEIIGYTRFWA
jgi:glycerol transport system permease protein